jgi:hypothetical protein
MHSSGYVDSHTRRILIDPTIQFGWDDPNIWKTRRDALFSILISNPKAKFVTRVVQFGSEPLYDNAIEATELTKQINEAKTKLESLHIPVTISEMAYGYQVVGELFQTLSLMVLIQVFVPEREWGFDECHGSNRLYRRAHVAILFSKGINM